MNFFTYVTDLFFPPQCVFCDTSLSAGKRPLVCDDCCENYMQREINCPKCNSNLILNDDLMPVCTTCKIAGRYYDGALFVCKYDSGVKTAIHRYKFSRQLYIGDVLSGIMAAKIKTAGINKYNTDLVLSVPSDKRRNAARGFDAAGAIAKKTAELLKIDYGDGAVLRIKDIERQSSLSYSKRQQNVRGAFKVANPDFLKGKRVLLIDDIITTGATVIEISRILKRAGVKYIFVASVAKTAKRNV